MVVDITCRMLFHMKTYSGQREGYGFALKRGQVLTQLSQTLMTQFIRTFYEVTFDLGAN